MDVVHGGRRAVIPLMVDIICPGSRHYCLVVLILGSSLKHNCLS